MIEHNRCITAKCDQARFLSSIQYLNDQFPELQLNAFIFKFACNFTISQRAINVTASL